jgi:LEA14-like dessication related protein
MKRIIFVLTALFLLSPIYSENFGIGADPSTFNITLGNNTTTSNDIIYLVKIFNTGDIPIIVKMFPDQNMINFSSIIESELIIEANKTKDLNIKFIRNGSEEKTISGTIRIIAEPEDSIQKSLIAIRPAIDLKIVVKQLPLKNSRKNISKLILILFVLIFSWGFLEAISKKIGGR